MAPTLMPCICGCTRRGEHLPTCGQPCPCHCHDGADGAYPCDIEGGCYTYHREPAGECPGCVPTLASRGLVCGRCHNHASTALDILPDLLLHLRNLARLPGATAPDPNAGGSIASIAKRPAPPIPLDDSAADAADLIWATLVGWVRVTCEELNLHGPDIPSSWRTPGSDGQIAGLRAGSTGAEAGPVARWMLWHLDLACEQPWVEAMLTGDDAFPRIVHQARRRWPLEDRATRVRTPCPACQRMTLEHRPPRQPRGPDLIACTGCSHTVSTDMYDPETRTLATASEDR